MKKSWNEKITVALKEAHIPSNIIDTVATVGKNNLAEIAHSGNTAALTALPGIGEKRAPIIIGALKRCTMNARFDKKAAARDKGLAFTLRTFPNEELFRDLIEEIKELVNFKPDEKHPEATLKAREKLEALTKKLLVNEPFTVRQNKGSVTRLQRSIISDVFGVDYDDNKPRTEFIIAEHKIQKLLKLHWSLFSPVEKEGLAKLDELCRKIYIRLGTYGVKVLPKFGAAVWYGGIASSASHQKNEKLLMAEFNAMKAHADFLWLGQPIRTFMEDMEMTGAEFWKVRANIIRPILRTYKDENGNDLTYRDVLIVKDVKKTYEFAFARRFGGTKGATFTEGKDKEDVILGDGAAIGVENGQGGGVGWKWMMIDKTSVLETLCEKYGITLKEVLDTEVEGIDGNMHRFGDFPIICGDGCWKFDKAFPSYSAYCEWMEQMAKKYPGVDKLYLLRQSEDIEGEEKVRRLTRTLIQQWMHMSGSEMLQLTKKARRNLKEDKTLEGAIRKMTGLFKSEEDRTAVERIFTAAPWLVMNPAIQMYLKEKWTRKQVEALSGKFRTEGQYPYIMQDPVALLEVWVLRKDPNDPELGILRGDEVSVANVPEGKKLCCVRFPANYLTAKVMVNRACRRAFRSLGNVAVISIHSDILIRQDGDVDGDEMCILYNRLAVMMTERMQALYNPPVILFTHAKKADKVKFGGREGFIDAVYTALWRAKKYDTVGINANLATALAYLASVAETNGDIKLRDQYLLWMSAASTSAIEAIDQVKGNVVDERLCSLVETIKKAVRKALRRIASELGTSKDGLKDITFPFVHYYVALAKNKPVDMCNCVPQNNDNLCDALAGLILRDTGKWEFDAQGAVWNKEAAKAILNDRVHTRSVMNCVVSKEVIEWLGDNWFRRALNAEDKAVLAQFREGNKISLKDVLMLLWRNEMSMSYSMEGSNLIEKRVEYRRTCKQIMYKLAANTEWVASAYADDVPAGYVYTDEEKQASIANAFLSDALELGKNGNGIEQKGGWAMFVLGVFAEEAMENLLSRKMDVRQFFRISVAVEDLEIKEVLDDMSDDEELFEASPEVTEHQEIAAEPDDRYIPSDEELERECPPDDEDVCVGFCD